MGRLAEASAGIGQSSWNRGYPMSEEVTAG
jgi:hypothetical protein